MMDVAKIESIAPGAERETAARSVLYRNLSNAFSFPWQEFHAAARADEIRPALEACLEGLPYRTEGLGALLDGLREVEPDYDEFQSAFVGLFDVGPGGPPCPLYGGAWGGDRQRIMEEALRFYRFFGLTISPEERELPDHLSTQLEFLHVLTFRELQARQSGNDPGSFRRAARDFLARHPGYWLPRAVEKLERLDTPRFWKSLVGVTALCCRADGAHLVETEGPVER